MLDGWWKTLGTRLTAQQRKLDLPDAPDPVTALASQLWEQALTSAAELAEAALAEERGALGIARLEADAQLAAAQQALEASQETEAVAVGALSTAQEHLQERQRLVDQQTAQLQDVARQRDEALKRASSQESEVTNLRERLEAQQAEASALRESQAAHLRAVENRAHGEIDRARQEARDAKQQLKSLEKSHSARASQLEADLHNVKDASANLARELAAEQARRETLEAQQLALRRSLEAAIAPPPKPKRPRARPQATQQLQQRAQLKKPTKS